jgi:hypothetical protein
MSTERYYKLKLLESLLDELRGVVRQMASNENLPVFDSEWEESLRCSYYGLTQRISELKNELF